VKSGDVKGTVSSDIRCPLIANHVRRHLLISIRSAGQILCHVNSCSFCFGLVVRFISCAPIGIRCHKLRPHLDIEDFTLFLIEAHDMQVITLCTRTVGCCNQRGMVAPPVGKPVSSTCDDLNRSPRPFQFASDLRKPQTTQMAMRPKRATRGQLRFRWIPNKDITLLFAPRKSIRFC